jgi:HEAT repeat protein
MSPLRSLRLLTVASLLLAVLHLGADEPVKAIKETYRGKTAKQWAARLTDKEWGERWWAAEAIAEIGPPAKEVVPDLIKALKDPEHFVRGAAARALGSIGPAAVEAVPALAAMLEDPSYVTTPHALKALRVIGPVSKDAAQVFVRQLCDEDVKIRNNSLEAFRHAGEAGKPAVPALIALFKAKKDREKLYVAQALLAIGPAASEAASVLSDYMAENRYLIATLKKAGGPLILSPNGKILATSGEKGVMLWDVGTWKERATLAGATFPAFFSPKGELIATAGGSRKVKIWNVATGKEGAVIESDEVIGFGSDNTTLATMTYEESTNADDLLKNGFPVEVKVWEVATGKEQAARKKKEGPSKLVVVRQRRLDDRPGEPRKETFEEEPGKGARQLEWFKDRLEARAADGKCCASVRCKPNDFFIFAPGPFEDKITVNNFATKNESVLEVHSEVTCLAFSPDGKTLLSADMSGTLMLWDVVSAKETASFQVKGKAIDYLALSPDGKIIFVGATDRERAGAQRFSRYDLVGATNEIQIWDAVKLLRRKIAKRSADEQESYDKLWADVADFLKKIEARK